MFKIKHILLILICILTTFLLFSSVPPPNCPEQILTRGTNENQGEKLRLGKIPEHHETESTSVNREQFRGMNGLKSQYDLVIVGAGLSGTVIAERATKLLGLKVLIIDKRDHIGGNCYDYIDEHGIRTSKYGVHIFHTKYDRVKEYVQQFSDWIPYEHRVVAKVKDIYDNIKYVPMPPNQETVNMLFNENISSKEDMVKWLNQRRPKMAPGHEPQNGEEMALSRVGKELYELLFKHYTKKQWAKYPAELDAAVLARLPYRENTDDRYFDDPWQHLPKNGYTAMFENMLLKNDKITVRLSTDYFNVKDDLPAHKLLIFTGPIDAYFASKGLPKLEYRSIYFETEYMEPTVQFFQPAWVVNYPSPDVNWTRISEYKHAPNQPPGVKEYPGTVVYREYSTDVGDPYYPVPNKRNQDLFLKYQELSLKEKGVKFVGRYFDDPWQHLPKNGYTAMFENMLLKNDKITVRLSTDYFK
ncbi:uncharacterized protein LOC111695623 [Eurytemora carolleeae]|uniref:uncharacterized protein LOC111695623 n=1 Tax=Eurytemora carolleeae TaxID=1294199 RepID=UPI000C75FDF6|nr:uncharacterized protein LOC111695623 [Eurytemora carolleeae]|eukprot:XP_023320773.1 uncharacterized protein LOC111695623 [Eurytemora affinis]